MSCSPFLSGARLKRFEAVQNCVVPRSRFFTEEQKRLSRDLVEGILRDKPAGVLCKLALFLFAIDLFALATGLRTFRGLSPERQTRLLLSLFDSPVPILRKGFWGLSTLAKLGAYGQESLYPEMGYVLKETPR